MRTPARLSFFVHTSDRDRVAALDLASEPWRFQSEIDHGLVQPYLAARAAGLDVALTSSVDAPLLVVHARQIVADSALRRRLEARAASVVVIRGSVTGPLTFARVIASELRAQGDSVAIPPLPHLALAPRDAGRGGRVQAVVTKGWRVHQPAFLGSPRLEARIEALGMRLTLEMEDAAGRRAWHDFTRADVVLALRSDDALGADGETGKPPTRLVNAWVAGCIPIVSREAVYARFGRDGEDMIVVRGEDDLVDALAGLRELPTAAGFFARSRARGASFAWQVTADRYVAFFAEVARGAGAQARA